MEALLERWWIYGGPRDFWVKNAPVIREFIAANKLPVITGKVGGGVAVAGAETAGERELVLKRIPLPGGIRIAHLHFDDQVYALTEEQWRTFCTQVMKDYQAKLARVKSVTFDQLMEISHAVDHLV